MRIGKYIKYLMGVCAVILLCACMQDDELLSSGGKEREVTFRPTLTGDVTTRAIGDGLLIDQLKVAVYEGDATKVEKFITTESWEVAQRDGVSLRLIEGHTYHILFWAESSENKAYNLTDDGHITVDYTHYIAGGFADMEQMDAFYNVSTVTVGSNKEENKRIELTRPLAQLNFADKSAQPQTGTHCTIVTLHSIPTAFNPFTGDVTIADNANVAFTFTDYPTETLSHEGDDYNYLSSNYLLAPATGVATIKATLHLQQAGGTPIKTVTFDGVEHPLITLEKNKKTNVYGNIVEQPQSWSVWDGTSRTKPDKDAQGRYVIDAASDVAWLCSPDDALETGSEFIQTVDINMDNKDITPMQLPAGSTYDGGDKQIINFDNSLFGDATELEVRNLTIENISATSLSHVGVLVNTLKGNSSFSNITITAATARTSNGAAGGMVGYVERKVQNDRNETLQVTFSNCKLNGVEADANLSEGKFVGLLCGYDNQETLTFDADCDADGTTHVKDYVSVYKKVNQSAWVEQTISDKYDGWVGHETYRRGKIYFAGVRLAPRWDGVTQITPLTEGSTKLIYSAFDLAYLQEVIGAQFTFKSDVDMGSKVFEPIMTATKVYGKRDNNDGNYAIYNLKVDTEFLPTPWSGGAFIRKMTSGSVENITIKDANVSVKNAEGGEDAYASILVATIEGDYVIVKNVNIDGGYLKGINKIGGIVGYVSCNLQATNCIVNGLTIENFTASNTGDAFESYGEIGGLIGFIQGNGSVISSCQVNNSTLKVKGSLLRYNNRFIGTANPSSGQKITIETNCSATGNSVTNEDRLKYGGFFFGIGGKTFDLLGGYSLSVLQGGDVYYGTTKLK